MTTVRKQIEAVRNNVGIWKRHDQTVLQFHGKDAHAWLHAQTTNDVNALTSGTGHQNAFLDRQGRLRAFFSLHRWHEEIWMIVDKQQCAAVQERIDSHVIIEDVQMDDVGHDTPHIIIEGPQALLLLTDTLDPPPESAAAQLPRTLYSFAPIRIGPHEVLVFQSSTSGEDGFVLIPAPGESDALFNRLQDRLAAFLGEVIEEPAQETLRIEAANVKFGVEVDTRCIISETQLYEETVSMDKGCYLGQEVVARLKAYGALKRSMVGIQIPENSPVVPEAGTQLYDREKRIGEVRSSVFSPTLHHWIALVYLDRDHRTPTKNTLFGTGNPDNTFRCDVVPLPFYTPARSPESARKLYDNALRTFEHDPEDEDTAPIKMLKQAIILDPTFEDAYEALGVILHRHHNIDEAIHYMKTLEKLNPHCVMAHTNLSVFYMSKGMIEQAEEEKALAEQLEMTQSIDAKKAKQNALQERKQIQQQAEERIAMFQEVLDIDPEDAVATMGLGTAYMQMSQHDAAVAPLKIAIRTNKDYSAAYLKLGQCLEFLDRRQDAVNTYQQGIEAASRKGDLIPMRQMQQRLKALTHTEN